MCRKNTERLCSIKLSFSSFLWLDVLDIFFFFFSFALFVFFGFHSLLFLCPHLHRHLPLRKYNEQFSFLLFPSQGSLPLTCLFFLSVLHSSSFSLKACDLGWQFLSSERSASLFLRSALILPTNRRGAPPTEQVLIGQTGRQIGTSLGSQAGRDTTRAWAALVECECERERTARRSRGTGWGLCRGKFPIPSRR